MKALLILFFGLLLSVANADESDFVYFQPCKVVLDGSLRSETKFGPPGFGENPESDEKYKIYVLDLSKPINIRGAPGSEADWDTLRDVSAIQLEMWPIPDGIDRFVSKHVFLSGKLKQGLLPSHFYEVIISEVSISATRPAN